MMTMILYGISYLFWSIFGIATVLYLIGVFQKIHKI